MTRSRTTKNQIELLRLEVRLSDKRKMNQVLKKLGFPINPTFKEIFKKDISQKVIQMYWQHFIAERNLFLFDLVSDPQPTLSKIIKNNKEIKPKEAIYRAGLATLARDKAGIRGLRNELKTICDRRTWYRIADDFKLLDAGQSRSKYHSWINDIEDQLKAFETYKLPRLDM